MIEHSKLQIAQVLADLADLSLADEDAAHALVSTHKTLSSDYQKRKRSSVSIAAPSIPRAMQSLSTPDLNASRELSMPPEVHGEADEDLHRAVKLVELYDLKSVLDKQSSGMRELQITRNAVTRIHAEANDRLKRAELERVEMERTLEEWAKKVSGRQAS